MPPIRIEAETMSLSTYRIEANSSASGGSLISLVAGDSAEVGTASFTFGGPAGLYDIVIGYYDETDGTSSASVYQEGTLLSSWSFNKNLGSGSATNQTRTQRTIATGATINSGETFLIRAAESSGEPARIDYIEFIPIIPPADTTAPTASLTATNITTADSTTYQFTVTYADNAGVAIASLDSSDIRVIGPNNFDQIATLINVSVNRDGTPRTATYQITAPGGTWDLADNGTYSVSMRANQVQDINGNWVASGAIGSFQTNIAAPPPPPSAEPNFTPIRIEAESMALNTFRIENNSSASGGSIISLVVGASSETGTASFNFNGPSGLYDVVIGYHDESDGSSTVSVSKQGTAIGSWTFNQNRGDTGANAQTRTQRMVATSITVNQGETFQITGKENSGEPARIDYIEFIPRTPGTINGTSSNDLLIGDAKDNTINGFGGNDVLKGNAGKNILNGGEGIDTADYSQLTRGIIANLSTGTVLAPLFGTALPKIMPLGDSITEGLHRVDPYPGAYRIKLWQNLGADSLTTDFVGSQVNGPDSLGDRDHEGHGGWTINQIQDLVNGGILSTHQPDVVLLMIGANDANSSSSLTTMYNNLSNLIDRITTLAPNTQLVVSSLTPMNSVVKGSSKANLVKNFNALIPDLVSDKAAQGKNVMFANAGGSLTVSDLVSDGLHPSAAGYSKLGDAWHNNIVDRDTLTSIENVTGTGLSDKLTGNGAANVLTGGGSGDVLTGGGNTDIFIYQTWTEGNDTLTDFDTTDIFRISAAGFGGGLLAGTALTTSNSNTGVFVSDVSPTAVGSSANFLYNTSNGLLSFDRDGSGEGAAVAIANLVGAPTLSANQFTIIA
ncbi:GDSL-type esterase/lipase family protein [Trichocoleus sp. FACHB-262]|uniref:GDSL-type esterase/lipase family protein n=1 Tax=Trichocoleus sp. FACHB-262 TaxID=2692869 RepID=UPI001682CFE0|nr:GDSL-type esterase/lipase family protein [Trichocoleus sp. FACHB-262]MBD2119883.1 hypothetical protein [Trichocoleus sp. FACHB-262]